MTTFQWLWLIERGQPEGEPQAIWLEHSLDQPARDRCWTTNAYEAAMFPDRETAEAYIADERLDARAVEHGFMPPPAPERCAYTTAAGIRCRRDAGHAGAHDTLYIFDALPERPEPIEEPLPEDLERVLRDPEIVIDKDADVSALIADWLHRDLTVETVPRGAYLMLWALYRKATS